MRTIPEGFGGSGPKAKGFGVLGSTIYKGFIHMSRFGTARLRPAVRAAAKEGAREACKKD